MVKRGLNSWVSTLVAVTLTAAIFSGCGAAQKAIKSGDGETIYNMAMELYEAEKWSKAAKMFEYAAPYYANRPIEDSLQFYIARCRFKNGEFDEAVYQLDNFRRKYGRSAYIEDVEGMYTLSHYYLAPAPERDQSPTLLAISVIDEFKARYPNSNEMEQFNEMREELVKRLHESSYLSAYTYYNIGRYKSAIVALRNALKKYPDSAFREEIFYYTVASAYHLALNSIDHKREERYLNMVDNYYSFIGEYPDSEYRADVENMERKARKFLDNIKSGMTAEEATALQDEELKQAKKELKAEQKAQKKECKSGEAKERRSNNGGAAGRINRRKHNKL
ncbi:MAG: outer membrane protein assembly factor BamD [Rikenellaceae bacterium]